MWLVFSDITRAGGFLSVPLWPTSTLSFLAGPAVQRDPAYQGLPMFSEEKVKETRNDSLHLHMAARHVDARAVCLFALAPRGPVGRPHRVPCKACTVLNLCSFGDCPARYGASVSHSMHPALKLDNSVSMAAVDNMLASYLGWKL